MRGGRAAGSLSNREAGHRGRTRDSWGPHPQGQRGAKSSSQPRALAACEEGRCGEEGSRPNRGRCPRPVPSGNRSEGGPCAGTGLCPAAEGGRACWPRPGLLCDSKSRPWAARENIREDKAPVGWTGKPRRPAEGGGGGGEGRVGSLWMEQSWRGRGWERLCIENGQPRR